MKWESLALNFVMVFSPNTLAGGAAQSAGDGPAAARHGAERRSRHGARPRTRLSVGQRHPGPRRHRRFAKLFAKVMVAVQVAGSVTLAAGALVLAGALATAQRRRILEAVILKTIGARRRQILKAHAYEYALLAAIAALVAIGLGSVVALGRGDPIDGNRLRILGRGRFKDAGGGGGDDYRLRGDRHLGHPAGAGRALSPFRIVKVNLFGEGLESAAA